MTGSTPNSQATDPALTPQQEADIRALLADLRSTNEADLRGAQATLATLTAEGALSDAAMREVVTGAEYMIQDAAGILALIDDAERLMAAGEYGRCSACGSSIPWERLQLRPYRSTCVACS